MIILGMTTQFKPQANKAWSFGDRSKPSDMFVIRFCFIEAYFVKKHNGAFARYITRFINDDLSFHPVVRREARRARSVARAEERSRTEWQINRLNETIKDCEKKNRQDRIALGEAQDVIKGLKIALRELQE